MVSPKTSGRHGATGRCRRCARSGIRSRTRSLRGGHRTPRRPTPRGWLVRRPPSKLRRVEGGRRKGPPMGCPRRKTKHRSARSCRFTTGPIRVESDRHHVRLPRLGAIRTHESTRKLARRLEDGRARILSATVRQEACGRWYVSLQAEVARAAGVPAGQALRPGSTLGCRIWLSSLTRRAGSGTSRTRSTWSRRCPYCAAALGRWHGGVARSAATRLPGRRSGRFRRPAGVMRGGRWPGLMSGCAICGPMPSRSSPARWRASTGGWLLRT